MPSPKNHSQVSKAKRDIVHRSVVKFHASVIKETWRCHICHDTTLSRSASPRQCRQQGRILIKIVIAIIIREPSSFPRRLIICRCRLDHPFGIFLERNVTTPGRLWYHCSGDLRRRRFDEVAWRKKRGLKSNGNILGNALGEIGRRCKGVPVILFAFVP